MIENYNKGNSVDRTGFPLEWGIFPQNKKTKYNIIKFILICIGVSLLLLWLTSCKKQETKPAPAPQPTQPAEVLWLLGGDWKPTPHFGADTVFGPTLHINKCCDGPNGEAVYNLSYPIWWHTSTFMVTWYYNTDSLWFDNGIVGVGGKTALFVKIK